MFSPGKWLGEGKICLNMVEEELVFFTRWTIAPEEDGFIECEQEIQVKGLSDVMTNHFRFSNIHAPSFSVFMENHAIGKVDGDGIVNESLLGWEFRVKELGFEGFEYYEKQPDDSYLMQAEFATVDQLRTVIRGRIWKQAAPS
jgi:hypothetical protein